MEGTNAPITENYAELENLQLEVNNATNDKEFTNPYKPGWNDPPQLSYSNLQTTPHKPRNHLKKRVAYPVTGITTSCNSVNIPTLPIVDTSTTSQNIKVNSNPENVCINSECALEEVRDILTTLLNTNTELGAKINDIKKRISKMEDMWANEKLNDQVQVQMTKLAKALQEGDTEKADDIHKALMVDHVREVCTWMPGIKQLIYHCAARAELMAIDND